jgi:hypothetical protein
LLSSGENLDSLLWRLDKKLMKEKARGIIDQNPYFYHSEALKKLLSSFSTPPFYLIPLRFQEAFFSDAQLVVCFDSCWYIWLDTEAPKRFGNVWKSGDMYILKGKHLRISWLLHR